jgi:hypothetical protein
LGRFGAQSGHAARVARIIIIDDDEPFRALLLEMLIEAGHTAVAPSTVSKP